MENYRNELSQKEITKALKLFKKWIDEPKNEVIIKHANPLQEYCYISTNDVYGIYFPNSQITTKLHKYFYNFCCIGKNKNGELGVVFSAKEDKDAAFDYVFEPFEPMPENYWSVFNKITKEQNTLIDQIFELESLQVLKKKDGGQFVDFVKNFTYKTKNRYTNDICAGTPKIEKSHNYYGKLSSVDFKLCDATLCFYDRQNKEVTIDEILTERDQRVEQYKNKLQKLENTKKKLKENLLKAESLKKKYLEDCKKIDPYIYEELKIDSWEVWRSIKNNE